MVTVWRTGTTHNAALWAEGKALGIFVPATGPASELNNAAAMRSHELACAGEPHDAIRQYDQAARTLHSHIARNSVCPMACICSWIALTWIAVDPK